MPVTLSMTNPAGTSYWYLGYSLDDTSWRYFSGPVVPYNGLFYLTEQASEAAAQANAVPHTTLGSEANSTRVDLPVKIQTRFIRLFHQATVGATVLKEFFPRRLVEADDIRGESILGVHVGANVITGDHLIGTAIDGFVVTGATIRTNSGNPRVELNGSSLISTDNSGVTRVSIDTTGLKTYSAAGVLQVQATTATDGALTAGGGNVLLNAAGQRFKARTVAYSWPALTPDSNTLAWLNASDDAIGFIEGVTTTDEVTTPILLISSAEVADTEVIVAGNGSVSLIHLESDARVSVDSNQVSVTGDLVVTGDGISYGSARIPGGLNVGTSTGAALGELRASAGARFGGGLTLNSASTAATGQLIADRTSDGDTAQSVAIFARNIAGTPSAGNLQGVLNLLLKSSTTTNREAGRLLYTWAETTDASRRGLVTVNATDAGGVREGLRVEAGGSEPKTSVNGVVAVARQTIAAAATDAATTQALANSIRTILINFGIAKP